MRSGEPNETARSEGSRAIDQLTQCAEHRNVNCLKISDAAIRLKLSELVQECTSIDDVMRRSIGTPSPPSMDRRLAKGLSAKSIFKAGLTKDIERSD